MLCDTYTHNGIKAKETITFKCKQPLVGTYLEIVPSLNKPIKVFEIEHYGMFIYNYFCYCSKFHLNNENLQRLPILNESISGFFKYYIPFVSKDPLKIQNNNFVQIINESTII